MFGIIKDKYDTFYKEFFSYEVFLEYIFYVSVNMNNKKIIKEYGSLNSFFKNVIKFNLEPYFSLLKKYLFFSIKDEMKGIKEFDIKILHLDSEMYPKRLKKIKNPPKFLFYKGDLGLHIKSVAVVGTRNSDKKGELLARYFTERLVKENITVVSGGARGIDTFAQKEALKKNGNIIIVTGIGLMKFFGNYQGREYLKYKKNILFLTEFPMFFSGSKQSFPIRNRVISGLSLGVLMIQAPESSGALYTAKYAIAQNIPLFVPCGDYFNDKFKGNLNLLGKCKIERNIYLLTSVDDILKILNIKRTDYKDKEKKLNFSKEYYLNEFEKKILSILKDIYPRNIQFDELFELNMEMGFVKFQESLLNLMINDQVSEEEGKRYVYKS